MLDRILYDLFGLDVSGLEFGESLDLDKIRKSYRKLMSRIHPDKCGLSESTKVSQIVISAFFILSNPDTELAYRLSGFSGVDYSFSHDEVVWAIAFIRNLNPLDPTRADNSTPSDSSISPERGSDHGPALDTSFEENREEPSLSDEKPEYSNTGYNPTNSHSSSADKGDATSQCSGPSSSSNVHQSSSAGYTNPDGSDNDRVPILHGGILRHELRRKTLKFRVRLNQVVEVWMFPEEMKRYPDALRKYLLDLKVARPRQFNWLVSKYKFLKELFD